MGFWTDFVAFNINAFYGITYFIWQNIFVILGVVGMIYCFLAEESMTHETEVRDERQIM